MQRVYTGTTIGIRVSKGITIRNGVCFPCTHGPSILVTDGSVEHIVCTLKNHQMHDDYTVATYRIRKNVGIITALRDAHVLIPVKRVTSGFRHMRGIAMQRKSYRHHIVRGIAFGLQAAILGDTCSFAVYHNHHTVKRL